MFLKLSLLDQDEYKWLKNSDFYSSLKNDEEDKEEEDKEDKEDKNKDI